MRILMQYVNGCTARYFITNTCYYCDNKSNNSRGVCRCGYILSPGLLLPHIAHTDSSCTSCKYFEKVKIANFILHYNICCYLRRCGCGESEHIVAGTEIQFCSSVFWQTFLLQTLLQTLFGTFRHFCLITWLHLKL